MAKPDYAHKLTDAQLAKLENRIAKLYKEAADELTDTVKAYFEQFEKHDAAMKEKLDAGEITEQQYKQWRLAQMGRGKRFTALRDKVAERYTDANATAVAYVNDATPGIYSLNRNYAAYKIEQVSSQADFTLWDEQTVKRLIVEQPDLMPYYPPKRALQRGIDLKYGKQQITASVTSSILQGKGIGKIANDLQSRMQDMSRASAIRAARTATTAAECAGRLDSYLAAKDMGIDIRQEWVATLDGRTRHAHAAADGQVVDVDKPFVLDGYHLMYPGDSSAPGYLVYNCRCTTVAVLDGVDTGDAMRMARDPETGQNVLVEDMTYDEWVKWKMAKGAFYDLSLQPKPVTMESINRVKVFHCETLDAAAQTRLRNMHKQLLLAARKQPLGTEVARIFGCDMGELTGYIVGDDNQKSVYIPKVEVEHIAIHTHPSSSTFSPKDLLRFAQRDKLKMLTAIGHDGHIYAIEKTDGVEKEVFMKRVHDISATTKVILASNKTNEEKLVEINAFIRESLKNDYTPGVNYYEQW